MSDIQLEFGTTADGLMAARLDYLAIIAIPAQAGFRIATGYMLRRPIAEWSQNDVYDHDGIVADKAGFSAHVEVFGGGLSSARRLGAQARRIVHFDAMGHLPGRGSLCRGNCLPHHRRPRRFQARPRAQRCLAPRTAGSGWVV